MLKALSPCGCWVAVLLGKHILIEQVHQSGRPMHQLVNPYGVPLSTVSWSADSTIIAAGGQHGEVIAWHVATKNLLLTGHLRCRWEPIEDIAVSLDKSIVTALSARYLFLWNVAERRLVEQRPLTEMETSVLSSSSKSIVTLNHPSHHAYN